MTASTGKVPYRAQGRSISERFWGLVAKTDGCWEWTGQLRGGYGVFAMGRSSRLAHRMSWEMATQAEQDAHWMVHAAAGLLSRAVDALEGRGA